MPRTKINRNNANNKRLRENTADLEEILRDYDIECKKILFEFHSVFLNSSPSVENSIAMLQSEHNKGMRDFDLKIEEIKQSIPVHILSMKLCDVLNLKSFNDNCIEEMMTNLNVTIKETVQKADEGKIFFLFSVFSASFSSFATFSSVTYPSFPFLCMIHKH